MDYMDEKLSYEQLQPEIRKVSFKLNCKISLSGFDVLTETSEQFNLKVLEIKKQIVDLNLLNEKLISAVESIGFSIENKDQH